MNYLITLAPLFLLTPPVYASQCSLSGHSYTVPQSDLPPVSGESTLGDISYNVGRWNYTCSSQGTYESVGPYSQYYDLTCYYDQPCYSTFSSQNIGQPHNSSHAWDHHEAAAHQCLGPSATYDGYFYSQYDFSSNYSYYWSRDNSTYDMPFIRGHLSHSAHGSDSTYDSDWHVYTIDPGYYYNEVYEIYTYFGQPPSSCKPGESISMQYSSEFYWYYTPSSASSSNGSNGNTGGSKIVLGANASGADSSSIQTLLNYSIVLLALLVLTGLVSIVTLSLGIFFIYKHRASMPNTRTAPVYQPVQLFHAPMKQPVDDPYYEETYGA